MLFVGRDGSSPQIAAGLLRRLTGDGVEIATARLQPADPGGRPDELLVAMGLDPAGDERLTSRTLHTADRVISLGRGLDVARLPGPRYEEWDLETDDLADRVQRLSEHLTTGPPTSDASPLGRLRVLIASFRLR